MSAPVLEVSDVFFAYMVDGYPDVVLRGIDLRVERGEFVAIQGSSGSGKSTLLYILGFLLEPDHGEIKLCGTPLSSLTSEGRAYLRNRSIGFVFQQFHLLARATILENILLPKTYPCEIARRSPEDRARAISIARRLGLGDHLEHHPNQLSGGQQQRVAIARALMNDVDLILADEPTGNLDSVNAQQTIELLKELNRQGTTVVLITHDADIARQAQRIYHVRDGMVVSVDGQAGDQTRATVRGTDLGSAHGSQLARTDARVGLPGAPIPALTGPDAFARAAAALLPVSWGNIRRNKARSLLTMIGIMIGIASVLAMITLGDFTRTKILESYESLGINKLLVEGWQNYKLKAEDQVDIPFMGFDWEKDGLALREVFPQIRLMSPVLRIGNPTANYNGNQVLNDIFIRGVNEEFGAITNAKLAAGKFLDRFQVETHAPVCVIGSDIARELFINAYPIGQIILLTVSGAPDAFTCKVIGVFAPQKSNSEWSKPNYQIAVPYTLLPEMTDNYWETQIHQIVLQLAPGSDAEDTSKAIRELFVQKYGRSGRFNIDNDAVLIAQMKKFLKLFKVLLTSIAFISLFVGGIGITNMMLVSVSERIKEIGLRKALGATDFSVRLQLLLEAVLLCAVAGLAGIVGGFSVYELLIWGASKLVAQLKFEWVVNAGALTISVIAVLAVGIASGIVPALRAERLQVIEALRSD